MESKTRKNLIKGTLVAGALLSITALSAAPNSSSLFNYNALGSGAEVRSEILQNGNNNPLNVFEANCGEKTTAKEGKTEEQKCGEGKCGEGEKKAETKSAETTKAKATKTETESKTEEGKCGEGKCGDN